jgi:hypothetical protein
MRAFNSALTLALVIVAIGNVVLAQDDQLVRSLELQGLKRPFPKGAADKPLVIATAADLMKAFPEEAIRTGVAKQVDFDKEKLLFFAWSGSGQDKLTPTVVKDKDNDKKTVAFTYQRGLTRDLRAHFRLFALPKDIAWRVERAGR